MRVGAAKQKEGMQFIVESKEFEIIGDERKGKIQVLIVENKGGVSSWVRLGSNSLGLFLEGLNLCIKDENEARWEGSGRNRVKGKEGWMTMAEKLKEVIDSFVSKSKTQEGKAMTNIVGGSSYATIAKRALLGNQNTIVVKVRREESMGLLKKLEHCVVPSRKGNLGGDDDLEKLGQLWAKSWELKGNLGLAKMENGRYLLDFEDLEEACRVVIFWKSHDGRSPGRARFLESEEWVLDRGGEGKEIGRRTNEDVRRATVGQNFSEKKRRCSTECSGSRSGEEVYEVSLWWECCLVIRRSSRQADGRRSSEVGVRSPHARRSE
ncbi:hypothetical protein CK203_082207 [Vitis vinifera]|uniref:DUF4283 domain-containing protein n=1 Tax=Vitis vinifera TaxID=29760 RepID=A0A438CNA1_VITVI|nr:hypothetical protein CK203_082207 [Vitis vinifera]